MRVLVVGMMPSEAERMAARLVVAGHDVVGCHDAGEAPFPCVGLGGARQCPLDQDSVDVAVTVRARPWPRPSPFEDGAVCALRRHIPLVVAGNPVHPFGRWATREIEIQDDVVAACEAAARAPLSEHSEVATDAAREILRCSGMDPAGASATVRRERGRLRVAVALPERDRELDAQVAVSVLAALRRLDTHSDGIDISIEFGPGR